MVFTAQTEALTALDAIQVKIDQNLTAIKESGERVDRLLNALSRDIHSL